MLQQLGYKTHEYRGWVGDHFASKVITAEHLLFNAVILVLIYFLAEDLTFLAAVVIMTVFTIFWFGFVHRYKPDRDKKPLVLTSRAKRLTATLALLLLPIYYLFGGFIFSNELFVLSKNIREPVGYFLTADPYFLGFLLCLVDIAVPFLVFPAAWLMKPVEKTIQNGFKRQAREKLASMPHLKIVAITGSYGKTSTKFLIEAFLKERLNVCVTPGSYNTPMGICKVINNDLNASHQVLILEMGARYPGNIQELCDIARPDISVVTNVGVAHLETFGSQDVIAQEKSGIVKNLKPEGAAILNADDSRVIAMAELREDITVITAGIENGQIKAREISYDHSGTRFRVETENGATEEFNIQLLGKHNVQNLLLGIGVARHFSIRLKTMALAASKTEPVEHRLELKKQGDLTVIDDAFNSNPVGAKNAVDILTSFKNGRKIIITPGMIELGEIEEEENRAFGEHIGQSEIDLAILVGEEITRPIREGIESVQRNNTPKIRTASSLFDANDILREYMRPGDVVLYENDLPDSYNE